MVMPLERTVDQALRWVRSASLLSMPAARTWRAHTLYSFSVGSIWIISLLEAIVKLNEGGSLPQSHAKL